MKVLHITQFFHPERGYQENFFAIYNRKRGYNTFILTSNNLKAWGNKYNDISWQEKADHEFQNQHDVTIIRCKQYFEYSKRLFLKGVLINLRKVDPDVVFIHGISLPLSLISMYWASKNRKKIIVDDHMVYAGVFNKYSSLFHSVFKVVFPLYLKIFNIKVNKWIGVCTECIVFMRNEFGIKDEIELIPLGYDHQNFYYDPEGANSWRKENNLPSNTNFFLYIGKIDEYKNPVEILEPFSKFLKTTNNKYSLLFVGDASTEYLNVLEEEIKKFNLTENVFVRESVKNKEMRFVFSLSTLVIWPNGSSMAMIEAMACKCPVIASKMDVNIERLSEGRGVVFEKESKDDLVRAINEAITSRNELIENSYKWVKSMSWDKLEQLAMSNI